MWEDRLPWPDGITDYGCSIIGFASYEGFNYFVKVCSQREHLQSTGSQNPIDRSTCLNQSRNGDP